jgi:hypothetical protein
VDLKYSFKWCGTGSNLLKTIAPSEKTIQDNNRDDEGIKSKDAWHHQFKKYQALASSKEFNSITHANPYFNLSTQELRDICYTEYFMDSAVKLNYPLSHSGQNSNHIFTNFVDVRPYGLTQSQMDQGRRQCSTHGLDLTNAIHDTHFIKSDQTISTKSPFDEWNNNIKSEVDREIEDESSSDQIKEVKSSLQAAVVACVSEISKSIDISSYCNAISTNLGSVAMPSAFVDLKYLKLKKNNILDMRFPVMSNESGFRATLDQNRSELLHNNFLRVHVDWENDCLTLWVAVNPKVLELKRTIKLLLLVLNLCLEENGQILKRVVCNGELLHERIN